MQPADSKCGDYLHERWAQPLARVGLFPHLLDSLLPGGPAIVRPDGVLTEPCDDVQLEFWEVTGTDFSPTVVSFGRERSNETWGAWYATVHPSSGTATSRGCIDRVLLASGATRDLIPARYGFFIGPRHTTIGLEHELLQLLRITHTTGWLKKLHIWTGGGEQFVDLRLRLGRMQVDMFTGPALTGSPPQEADYVALQYRLPRIGRGVANRRLEIIRQWLLDRGFGSLDTHRDADAQPKDDGLK
jgi:hypothetical protein